MRLVFGLAFASLLPVFVAAQPLSRDDMRLIQDPGGWEYISITDSNNGFKTDGACFTGHTKGPCQGSLTFHSDGTYSQVVNVSPKSVNRQGKYEISGSDLTLYDALGTKDGPYTIALDQGSHTLTLEMVQASVVLHIKLELESSVHRRQSSTPDAKAPRD